MQAFRAGGEDARKNSGARGYIRRVNTGSQQHCGGQLTAHFLPQPTHLPEVIHWPHMLVENDEFEQVYWGKVWSFDISRSITLFDGVSLGQFDLVAPQTTYTIMNAVKVGTKVKVLLMTDPYGHTSITIKPTGYETPYVFPG